jgi:hypothetical protein
MKAVTKQEILDGFGGKYTLSEASDIRKRIESEGISDGYHTFDELYEHRCLLFILLCLTSRRITRWKNDPSFEGWPCLYLETPAGQISYHVPAKYLPLFENKIAQDDEYKWDGHTPQITIERLVEYAKEQP